MKIDVSIPYELGERLGHAYNVAAGRAEDWFLFLDHDLCLVNPWWYEICVRTIEQYGDKAGLISCYTNRIGNRLQIAPGVDTKSEDLAYHRAFARSLYNRNRGKVLDHTAEKMRYSGFFILSRHPVWRAVGGFKEDTGGLFHIDVDYCSRVRAAGFRVLLMADLYVFHGYWRESMPERRTFERPVL